MFQKLLVATDGSEGAFNAVHTAVKIADKYRSHLVILYVYEMPMMAPMMGGGSLGGGIEYIDPNLMDEWEKTAQSRVKSSVKLVVGDRPVSYVFRTETGHAAETIARVAEEEGCDLLVVGSRGLSGMKAFFLGSVSERVAHLAHCSVLIVR